jgi:hypothetical protein
MVKPRATGCKLPSGKISATIIDFGAPLLEQLGADQPLSVVRSAFNIIITVWNAHVMAMPMWNAPHFLAHLEALLNTPDAEPGMLRAYDALAARRRERFANDPRAVGEWNVGFDANGRLRLHCDARVPPAFMPEQR